MTDQDQDQAPEVGPEATPENSTMHGQSFYAGHLTGSGTLVEDGQYGPPVQDPTVQRGGPKGYRTSPGGVDRSVDDREPPASPRPPATRKTPAKKSTPTKAEQTKAWDESEHTPGTNTQK